MNAKRALQVLALAFAPLALASGCGGIDDILGSDGGTGACPAGTTLYPIGGNYTTVVASNIVENCNENLAANATNLQNARTIVYDVASGLATVTSTNSGTQLGQGPVRCNKGTLTYGPATLSTSSCQWTTNRTVDFIATGDHQVTLNVSDDRTGTAQVQGGPTCGQPSSCKVSFTLTMSK